jgi:hypothetical protein
MASLAAGMLLVTAPENAVARNGDSQNGHSDHNGHDDHRKNSDHNDQNSGMKHRDSGKVHSSEWTDHHKSSQKGKTQPVAMSGGKKLPANNVVVTNGTVKLNIPNTPYGLTATPNKDGTITVSNGNPSQSVTLPGTLLTLRGATLTSLGGGEGMQLRRLADGSFAATHVVTAAPPTPAPKPAPKPVDTGSVTGGASASDVGKGVVGLGKGAVNGLKDLGEGLISIGSPKPGTPGAGEPKTSTTVQQ